MYSNKEAGRWVVQALWIGVVHTTRCTTLGGSPEIAHEVDVAHVL